MDRRTGARGPAGELAAVAMWDIGYSVTSVLSVRYLILVSDVVHQSVSICQTSVCRFR